MLTNFVEGQPGNTKKKCENYLPEDSIKFDNGMTVRCIEKLTVKEIFEIRRICISYQNKTHITGVRLHKRRR